MAHPSPIIAHTVAAEPLASPYAAPGDPVLAIEVIQAFGPMPLEYAAIRRSCGLLDLPHRATIEVTGSDRLDFLNRMVTQELRGLEPLHARRAFWLNRKGRIDADLRVIALGDRTLLELDAHALKRTLDTLPAFIFTEDVAFRDATAETHRLALHGPAARALLDAAADSTGDRPAASLGQGEATTARIAGSGVTVVRDDSAGEVGLELFVPTDAAARVFDRLLEAGGWRWDAPEAFDPGAARARVRPIGWLAYNVARIEAGTPLYYLDFGPDSLPHETGVLHDRVSFRKGCYLGQEVVARMESLGQPKQRLVALRFDDAGDARETPQPVTGDAVFAEGTSDKPIGAVTSSTISPMLGGVPVCFAMVRSAHAAPGARLTVEAGGARVTAAVQDGLAFHRAVKT